MATIDLPQGEILAQLAEEAAELSHAALKLRRALDGTNPTPMTAEEARLSLLEEIADVIVCENQLARIDWEVINDICERKLRRWQERMSK